MQEYVINVAEIEELQMVENRDALDNIFARAERTIIGGGRVVLVRSSTGGRAEKFDELSTEDDLSGYRRQVFRYL